MVIFYTPAVKLVVILSVTSGNSLVLAIMTFIPADIGSMILISL